MPNKVKNKRYFYLKSILFAGAIFSGFTIVATSIATAQEIVENANSISESLIAQSTPSSPNRPRLTRPFFEEQRKLKFGSGDFLESALNGADNFFAADSITNVSEQNMDLNAPAIPGGQTIPGTLTVSSPDINEYNLLIATFVSTDPSVVNLTFSSPSYGPDPRMGELTVNGTITVGGKTLTFDNVRANYSGSYSFNNNRVSGVAEVVDPNNPGGTILIQLPVTTVENVDDDSQSLSESKPATLSIGLPTDR
jgi:hypothetical protein